MIVLKTYSASGICAAIDHIGNNSPMALVFTNYNTCNMYYDESDNKVHGKPMYLFDKMHRPEDRNAIPERQTQTGYDLTNAKSA